MKSIDVKSINEETIDELVDQAENLAQHWMVRLGWPDPTGWVENVCFDGAVSESFTTEDTFLHLFIDGSAMGIRGDYRRELTEAEYRHEVNAFKRRNH
jgi:hypothetical protein